MSLSSAAALFGAMVVLAIIPSPSVFAVVARAIASGFTQGLITVLGIVTGDLIFILLAIGGLSAIAETMGGWLIGVKYFGAVYLCWLGLGVWRSPTRAVAVEAVPTTSGISSFFCGLLITLSDPKAILFYVSFLPTFLDLSQASLADIAMTLLSVMVAVGGGKLVYVYLADQARVLFQSARAQAVMNRLAGSAMIATGLVLVAKR
ncbi:MAG: LysE family translocator [Leptolyngbya sp. RL_3_1]|nr:LysE family translocator [Leptolyngbya sp. RL_3_1]